MPDEHRALAAILRQEHAPRIAQEDKRQSRSIDGIRFVNTSGIELHAVGLRIDRLCECECEEPERRDCSCFSDADLGATALYLSKNDLTSAAVESLSGFAELTVLSLANNLIDRVPEALRRMHKLKRLSLSGNPVMGTTYAWEQILASVPVALRELNGRRVNEAEVRRGRAVWREHCVLRNLVFLLDALRTKEPGEAWVEVLGRIEGVLVGGVSSLSQLADEHFLFDSSMSSTSSMSLTSSIQSNHGLAVLANSTWVDSVAFSMSDNVDDDSSFESVLLEVTSSLVSLESLCREVREGPGQRVAEVESLAASIWRAVFVYRDVMLERKRQEFAAAEEAVRVAAEAAAKAAGKLPVEQADLDRIKSERDQMAQELRMMKQELNVLRTQRDDEIERRVGLGVQLDDLRNKFADASTREHIVCLQLEDTLQKLEDARSAATGQKSVLQILNAELDASKKREFAAVERNQVLIAELDATIRARSIASKALRDTEVALTEAQESSADALASQKASFEVVLGTLRDELELLRRAPRVPVNIEIVNPDVTRALDERDRHIALLQSEVALYQRDEWLNATAQSYRQEKALDRMKIAAAFCFRGWMRHVHRVSATKRLETSIATIVTDAERASAVEALLAWRSHARTSRIVRALSMVRRAQVTTETMRRVFCGWSDLTAQCKRVDAFIQRRSSRIAQRALTMLARHALHRKESLQMMEREVVRHAGAAVVAKVFRAWHTETASSVNRWKEIETSVEDRAAISHVSAVFEAWRLVARDATQERLNCQVADQFAAEMVQRRAVRALGCHATDVALRRSMVDELDTSRARDLLLDVMASWRECLNASRLARACQWEHKRAMARSIIGAWRTHVFQATKSRLAGVQAAVILTGSAVDRHKNELEQRLREASDSAARTDALARGMAVSCDGLQRRLVESILEHRRVVYRMAEKHARLVKAHRTIKRQLNIALHDVLELKAARDELDAVVAREVQARSITEDALKRSLDESKHMSLRLRASDAIKSSAQLRAVQHARHSEDWSLRAGWGAMK